MTGLPWRASALSPRAGGGLVLATERGFCTFDLETGRLQPRLHPEPDRLGNRSNDGNVDAHGRFWAATMDDSESERSGALYRLEADWRAHRVLDGLGIPNALVSSPDGKVFYVADGKDQAIWAYDMEPGAGTLGDRRVFVRTEGDAYPDGAAVDVEGYLWNAQWGGWRVARYAPDGRLDRVIDMPVQQPSSVAFGGANLTTLYITSARVGLSEAELEGQPLAGGLFAYEAGVAGLGHPPFAG